MADMNSEVESDSSTIETTPLSLSNAAVQVERLQKRVESLQQENKVLRLELDQFKLKCKHLQEENLSLRQASVTIQVQAEQEEEFISNTLLKQIEELKKEKETLAKKFEQEEEFLTNDLSRRLTQLRQEKAELEVTLEKEQEHQVNKLMQRIEKLQAETTSKQGQLERLRREKIELENTLEHEQEALVNRLWKKMEKLEAEKRVLQERLDQPVSGPPSPRDMRIDDGDMASSLIQNIGSLRAEVARLRRQLHTSQIEHEEMMAHYAQEEKQMREENVRLERKLQREIERREALCRHLSESESSLEMDEERCFNEMSKARDRSGSQGNRHGAQVRQYSSSSPIPMQSPGSSRPFSPGGGVVVHSGVFMPVTVGKSSTPAWAGHGAIPVFGSLPSSSAAAVAIPTMYIPQGSVNVKKSPSQDLTGGASRGTTVEKFVKPAPPLVSHQQSPEKNTLPPGEMNWPQDVNMKCLP